MVATPGVTAWGLRIARWYCPERRRTFSQILLDSVEEGMTTVAHWAKSLDAAGGLFAGPLSAYPELSVGSAVAFNASERRAPPLPPRTDAAGAIDIGHRHFSRKLRCSVQRRSCPTFQRRLEFEAFRRGHTDRSWRSAGGGA